MLRNELLWFAESIFNKPNCLSVPWDCWNFQYVQLAFISVIREIRSKYERFDKKRSLINRFSLAITPIFLKNWNMCDMEIFWYSCRHNINIENIRSHWNGKKLGISLKRMTLMRVSITKRSQCNFFFSTKKADILLLLYYQQLIWILTKYVSSMCIIRKWKCKKSSFDFKDTQFQTFNQERWQKKNNPWMINFEDNPESQKYIHIFLPVNTMPFNSHSVRQTLTNTAWIKWRERMFNNIQEMFAVTRFSI